MLDPGFSERFIHSEVYKAYPAAQAVVHSHALPVMPFTISSVPLRACFHMAGFLGAGVPVWDFDTVYSDADQQDMLVRNAKLGASLARSLGDGEGSGELNHAVSLMRGHGMVVVAENIEMVVFKSVYTLQSAVVQQTAIGLGGGRQVLYQEGGRRYREYDGPGRGQAVATLEEGGGGFTPVSQPCVVAMVRLSLTGDHRAGEFTCLAE